MRWESSVSKLSEARTACKLAKHEDQQMVPMRHGPAFGPVFVLGDNAPGLPLREEAGEINHPMPDGNCRRSETNY
jgi:hypothetical protein